MVRANPANQADQAPANRIQVNRIQASRNPVSLNQVNQIRIHPAAANPIQATQATASPPAIATLVHLVAAIPARAIRVTATVASPIVQIVNRPARKAAANLKASRIPKPRVVIATRYRVTRGQATRSQVIPVAAALRLRAFPAKATANRRASRRASRKANPTASPKANRTVNRDPKANHQAVIVRKVDRVAIDQVTAKAIACHGQPVTQSVVPLVIRKAIQAADRQADLTVTHRLQPANRAIRQPVTQMILQQVIPQIHPPASHMTHPPASRIARV